jgi:sugar lactone lactonase YvrE
MKGNYIGKKPSGYGATKEGQKGIWEIYDQSQGVKDIAWAAQPWNVIDGFYGQKSSTLLGISGLISVNDVAFKTDGTKFYVISPNTDRIHQYSCSTAWDITTASYDEKSFSITAQETLSTGLYFKPDGTKFYIVGTTSDTVFQYSCSTAWDVSTASYDSKSFSVITQESAPSSVFFKSDGTAFYIVGTTNDTVYQYSCSTAWDVSTASYASKSFAVVTQETNPAGLFFKDDGTKFYVVGSASDSIYQYSCSTAWDVSTASYDSKSFNVHWAGFAVAGLFISSDGTVVNVIESTTVRVYKFTLGTAWDISTASVPRGVFSVNAQETIPNDFVFKPDGTKFYIVGQTTDTVYQYSCSTAWDVSTASYDSKSFSVTTQETDPRGLFFKSDGTKFYVVGQTNDTVYQYSCSTAWDVSTGSYDSKSFSVGGQETTPQGLAFKDDGTKFYIVGVTNDTVYQYSCSTAWDVSTASYDSKSFSVNGQDATPVGLLFKTDGTTFYVVGTTTNAVHQYSCSTAWDVSTASYIRGSIEVQDDSPIGVAFKDDGTKLYIIGQVGKTITSYTLAVAWKINPIGFDGYNYKANLAETNGLADIVFNEYGTIFYVPGRAPYSITQYKCTTPWDLSTSSLFNADYSEVYSKFYLTGQTESTLTALYFKPDGTKFYTLGSTADTIYQYSCSTAWDISTGSYDNKSFGVATQETTPVGLYFKPDGTKFYIIGTTADTVFQYSCSTAWDVSTASYDSKSFSTTSQDGTPSALYFKDDGTKLYVMGTATDAVFQYSCSTAWDISTASYDSISLSVANQDGAAVGVTIGYGGSLLYIMGNTNFKAYQYRLT